MLHFSTVFPLILSQCVCTNTYSLAVCPEAKGCLIIIINKLPLEVRDPRH